MQFLLILLNCSSSYRSFAFGFMKRAVDVGFLFFVLSIFFVCHNLTDFIPFALMIDEVASSSYFLQAYRCLTQLDKVDFRISTRLHHATRPDYYLRRLIVIAFFPSQLALLQLNPRLDLYSQPKQNIQREAAVSKAELSINFPSCTSTTHSFNIERI